MEWIVEAESLSDFIDHGRYIISSKPLIRCRDCKWSDVSAMGHLVVCNHSRGLVNASPNSYCNFAERRTDGVDS